ncbi:NADH-quinone oxidoreductase subunit N [candidate division FCPU426 bacterium]|nr:NADH-quinone oxidoreductase subunit N [candidate division FCPU426 bacterium]
MSQWMLLLPECVLTIFLGVALTADLVLPALPRRVLALLVLLGLAVTAACVWWTPAGEFGGVFLNDGFGRFAKTIVLAAAALVVLCAWDFDLVWLRPWNEFLFLLLASVLGMFFIASGRELVLLYVGLELATFPIVLLTAYQPADPKSAEGGLKFLILAALASAVLLFGLSLIYAATGTTQLTVLSERLHQGAASSPLLLMGLLFLLAGLGFKIVLAPFHTWAPDAYEGAPTPVTVFMSVASKTAGFVLAVRILSVGLPAVRGTWGAVLAVLAAVTMTLGNLAAIPQQNIKRLLAYSSIAQAGYMVMGLVAFKPLGLSALLYYLAAYLFTNVAAFAVVIALERATGSVEIEAYYGLAERSPRLALLMLLALLSLAGIPPLAGFTAKFYLFAAVYGQGYIWLVVLAVLNSALSLYYYLRVIRAIYIHQPEENTPPLPSTPWPLSLVMAVTLLGILLLGVYPGPIVEAARVVVGPLWF